MKRKILLIFIFALTFIVLLSFNLEEKKWQVSKIYNINEFKNDGRNIYIDEEDNLYVDYIDKNTKELCLDKYDSKTENKIMTIRTGYYVKEYEKFIPGTRTEVLGFLFKDNKLILVIPGNGIFSYYDIKTGKKIKEEIYEKARFLYGIGILEGTKNIIRRKL